MPFLSPDRIAGLVNRELAGQRYQPGTVIELPSNGINDSSDFKRLDPIVNTLIDNVPFVGIPQTIRHWKSGTYCETLEPKIRASNLKYRGQRFNGKITPEQLILLPPTLSAVEDKKNAQREPIPPEHVFSFLVLMGLNSDAARNFGKTAVETTVYINRLTLTTYNYVGLKMIHNIKSVEGFMTVDELLLKSGYEWLTAMTSKSGRRPITIGSMH
jgi:hypothetical protein